MPGKLGHSGSYGYKRDLLLAALLIKHRFDLDRQAKEVDKALGVLLVVNMVFAESRDFLVVEGVRRGNAGVDDVALVKLQPHFAGDSLLRLVDKGRQRLPQRVYHWPL